MLYVRKLDPRAVVPTCAHPGEDLAYDLYTLEDVVVDPGVTLVHTGIAVEHVHREWCNRFSDGLLIRDRSSLASNGVYVVGGVIDAGYRGEIIILMHSTTLGGYMVKAGDKIAQMIPIPVLTGEGVLQVEELHKAERGAAGFGSTGQ